MYINKRSGTGGEVSSQSIILNGSSQTYNSTIVPDKSQGNRTSVIDHNGSEFPKVPNNTEKMKSHSTGRMAWASGITISLVALALVIVLYIRREKLKKHKTAVENSDYLWGSENDKGEVTEKAKKTSKKSSKSLISLEINEKPLQKKTRILGSISLSTFGIKPAIDMKKAFQTDSDKKVPVDTFQMELIPGIPNKQKFMSMPQNIYSDAPGSDPMESDDNKVDFAGFWDEVVIMGSNGWCHWKEEEKLGGGAHQGQDGWSKTTGARDL
ncbi:hypothetical protein PPACK8108_LOCUS12027 [Phakopsora pachyrhizi]|uniref:Uncharacterized protein n=1 Tax=Phakopsora pachyrhizi TaxID=170000 RepID=A0AAV0B4N8_PHAPC|nr:hypothetical protein PPACK8108_LOCUS12027 [Phakopsora pachyrhizi]